MQIELIPNVETKTLGPRSARSLLGYKPGDTLPPRATVWANYADGGLARVWHGEGSPEDRADAAMDWAAAHNRRQAEHDAIQITQIVVGILPTNP